jgi:carbon-monoxide dehydrogenase medium subunit
MIEPQYIRATSVDQAIDALTAAAGDGLIIAGGIVVSSLFNQHIASPSVLVDISRIHGMRTIARHSGRITIGALATHDDLLRSPDVRAATPLLKEIAEEISCSRLRNRGTLGGSLCTIGGQGDPATGLIALGARLHLRNPNGPRTAMVEDFYKNVFEVDLAPDEIVVSVDVPEMKPEVRYGFCKLAPRKAMDWTQITVSVAFTPRSGAYGDIRIGMNGVANTPNRPRATESLISVSKLGSIDWDAVRDTLGHEISPQGDLIYSEQFKRHLALVALRRAVESASARQQTRGLA